MSVTKLTYETAVPSVRMQLMKELDFLMNLELADEFTRERIIKLMMEDK